MKFNHIPTWPEWQRASASSMQIRAMKPKLVKIDDLVKKYHQALDMSKLNILMELRKAIEDWAADKIDRNADTGRLEAMQALLDIVVRKLYELDGWGKHRYIKAACFGYVVKTGDYNPNLKPLDDRQRQKDETLDVGASCADLIKAIGAAEATWRHHVATNGVAADEDRKTLKIFMAPEFFFRGRYGAYRDIGWTSKILGMMRTETKKPAYDDWLFVHGTVIVSTETADGGKQMLENYALVQRGGAKTGETDDFVVAKEFPSHVDFQHPTVSNQDWFNPKRSEADIAGSTVKNVMPVGGRKDPIFNSLGAKQKSVSELVGGVIFTMDSITFGLEVCRDHFLRRLAHSQEKGKVLIQLVPSAGMSIDDDAIACVADGVVFNVDGVTPHAMIKVNSATAVQPAVRMDPGLRAGPDRDVHPRQDRLAWPCARGRRPAAQHDADGAQRNRSDSAAQTPESRRPPVSSGAARRPRRSATANRKLTAGSPPALRLRSGTDAALSALDADGRARYERGVRRSRRRSMTGTKPGAIAAAARSAPGR